MRKSLTKSTDLTTYSTSGVKTGSKRSWELITYMLHTSAHFPSYFCACSISGAAYAYDPQNVESSLHLFVG